MEGNLIKWLIEAMKVSPVVSVLDELVGSDSSTALTHSAAYIWEVVETE